MNFSTDKARKRILGSMLPQHVGESVCLLGTVVQLDSSGKVLTMKTSDDHHITVQLPDFEKKRSKMKVVKLSPDDPDIFQTVPSSDRCSFVVEHFEAFMQMYKTQGSTFWLRFLMSFKIHTEDKFCEKNKVMSVLMQHIQFIKVLNYVYIHIHKRFIESSNTACKKLVNNLITVTLNSPSYLNYSSEQWLEYVKTSKQLHTTFQNLFGMPDPFEYSSFMTLIFSVYIDFFCALTAVFEQWCKASDLTEEEVEKIDSKIIYWMPPYDLDYKIQPLCFEKYLSVYWKENLQRMLMLDNIHDLFSTHKMEECCDIFEKEKNLFQVFNFTDKYMEDLMREMEMFEEEEEVEDCSEEEEEAVHTLTEVCIKEVCILKPQAVVCTAHEDCFIKICHAEECPEPFICKGTLKCIKSCETKLKDAIKSKTAEKFWKTVSVELFPVDKNKRDASTLAESFDRDNITYLHLRKTSYDLPLSVMRSTYQCYAELHNFDLNPRKTECLNRLRKKWSQKNPLVVPHFNASALRQPSYRENIFENATLKMMRIQAQYCLFKSHKLDKCDGKCFDRDVHSVAISSSNAFGRVISLSKISINFPSDLKHQCIHDVMTHAADPKTAGSEKKLEAKKNDKPHKDAIKNKHNENCTAIESGSKANLNASSMLPSSGDIASINNAVPPSNLKIKLDNSADFTNTTTLKKETENSVTDDDEYSKVNIDDDIDEVCKLLGIGDDDDDMAASCNNVVLDKTDFGSHSGSGVALSKEDELVEDFLKLIGVSDDVSSKEKCTIADQMNKSKLKVCAFCKKMEPRRKTFKKCSMCKQDNFAVHHYYCSEECLMEDWVESHEDEHLKFKKQLL